MRNEVVAALETERMAQRAIKPVVNQDIVQDIEKSMANRVVTFEHIRGHSNNIGNELADLLANTALKGVASLNEHIVNTLRYPDFKY